MTTGDLEKARQPMNFGRPRELLSVIYSEFGQHDKSLSEIREALRLEPESGLVYVVYVSANRKLNRLEEARGVAEEAEAKIARRPRGGGLAGPSGCQWTISRVPYMWFSTAFTKRHIRNERQKRVSELIHVELGY